LRRTGILNDETTAQFKHLLENETENLSLHQEESCNVISFLRRAFLRRFPDIKIISTAETEIKTIIHSLKAKNSSGYDGITSKSLRVCASQISYPLTRIYNHSLLTEIFLNCFNSKTTLQKRRQN
jgi:hypothetical protein